MLLRSFPVILLTASSAWGQSNSVPPVRVFLFAGQSNMVGADTRPEIVDDYPPFVGAMQPQEDVRYAYSCWYIRWRSHLLWAATGGRFGLESSGAHSSVGQSRGLIIRWSQVRVLVGPFY